MHSHEWAAVAHQHVWNDKTGLVMEADCRGGFQPSRLSQTVVAEPHGFGPATSLRVAGPYRRVADAPLIAQIERLARSESYDEQPLPKCSPDDIDFDAAAKLFKPVRQLEKQDLITLRVLAKYNGRTVPTVGGILLFGKDRLRHFPDSYIKAGLFDGTDRRRILDSTDVQSVLPIAVDDALHRLPRRAGCGASASCSAPVSPCDAMLSGRSLDQRQLH